jgi:peptide deformylase
MFSRLFSVWQSNGENKNVEPQPQVFNSPEIVWSSEERSTYEEGCLSIPEYYAEVERPASVRARALDCEGKERQIVTEGLLATVLQHEIGHPNTSCLPSAPATVRICCELAFASF